MTVEMSKLEGAPKVEQENIGPVSEEHKMREVTEEIHDASRDQRGSTVVDEKTGKVSIESTEDEDTKYVKGHPVIRSGNYAIGSSATNL